MGGIRAGDAAIGLLVAALGLIGLIQAAGATDNEIYVFGLSLLGFAVVFDFGLLKRHFDTAGQWPEDGYNEAIVKKFLIASVFWGVVAFLVGVVLAAHCFFNAMPAENTLHIVFEPGSDFWRAAPGAHRAHHRPAPKSARMRK